MNESNIPIPRVFNQYAFEDLLLALRDLPTVGEEAHFGDAPGDILTILERLFLAQQTTSSEEDMFQCLHTMAKFHAATTWQSFNPHSGMILDEVNKVDVEDWMHLRQTLDCFRDDSKAFLRYARREFEKPIFQERLDQIQEMQEDVHAEAQALEARTRDHLQVNASIKSLEESRRSIEEARSVKLITILAFFFIPTSLASSLFGMNIQEINKSGKHISTFIVTAVLMTSAAFIVWGLSVLIRRAQDPSGSLNLIATNITDPIFVFQYTFNGPLRRLRRYLRN